MRIKIVDLDGCISDDRWRRHLIGPAPLGGRTAAAGWGNRFDAYHAAAFADDLANREEVFGWEGEIVICTARPVAYAELTREWLALQKVKPLHILHRNNDDHRIGAEVKATQVQWLLEPQLNYGVLREHIVDAIDDMEPIVRMYRDRFGIPARVVRIGAEEHANG